LPARAARTPLDRSISPASSSVPTSHGANFRAVPELPETETIARDLDREVAGRRIQQVVVRRADVLRETSAAGFIRRVAGTTIERSWRRAKLVVLSLSSGEHIVVQPRFTGALLIDDGNLPVAELQYSSITATSGGWER
jgi:formamidopyrimidine-DNA glycosylase